MNLTKLARSATLLFKKIINYEESTKKNLADIFQNSFLTRKTKIVKYKAKA